MSSFSGFYIRRGNDVSPRRGTFSRCVGSLLGRGEVARRVIFLGTSVPRGCNCGLLSNRGRAERESVVLEVYCTTRLALRRARETLEGCRVPRLCTGVPESTFLVLVFGRHPNKVVRIGRLLDGGNVRVLEADNIRR